jgi:arginyl-tRNA--protein-N-Asp/Glu arginylyltransferase
MTEDTSVGKKLDLYISSPNSCDYLQGKESQSIFISPEVVVTPGIYEYLISIGFRRSGQHTYRPHCANCRSCISCRLDSNSFTASRSQRRVIKLNEELTFTAVEAGFYDEHFELYSRYQTYKHPGGSMESFEENEFKSFLCDSFGNSVMYETRLGKQLIAVAVTDVFSNALSAVYTFFDPAYAHRSIGTYNILKQIQVAKEGDRQHLYLGYYIKDSEKMSYKANFRPIEMFIDGQWETFNKEATLATESTHVDAPLSF